MKKLVKKFQTWEYFILKDRILQKIFHFPSHKKILFEFCLGDFFDIFKNNIICVETTKGTTIMGRC